MTLARSMRALVRCVLPAAALLLLAPACGDDDDDGATPAGPTLSGNQNDLLKGSWVYYVVEDPARLGPFEQGATGDAWLSLFHNDLRPALRSLGSQCNPSGAPLAAREAAGFPCVALARTHLEIAEMYAGAAEIERVARRQFYLHRRNNAEEVLASTHQPYFEAVTLLQSGEQGAAKEMLEAYAAVDGADPLLKHLAVRIVEGLGSSDPLVARLWGSSATDAPADATLGPLPESASGAVYAARLAFAEAVAKGDIAGATSNMRGLRASDADLREKLAQRDGAVSSDVDLAHGDPLLQRSLARLHALQALAAIGGAQDLGLLAAKANRILGREVGEVPAAPSLEDGLALVLFSTAMTPEDLRAGLTSPAPRIDRLAAGFPELGQAPSKDLADLDTFVSLSNNLRATIMEMMRGTREDAAGMVADMGLGDRFMSQLLQERAKQYQGAFSVRMDAVVGDDVASAGVAVRSLLEHALDKNPSPPSQQLKRARISFRNDPPALVDLARANLDTRRPYDANEYIRPLTEVYPELIPVREALAALDSAWNPARKGSVR